MPKTLPSIFTIAQTSQGFAIHRNGVPHKTPAGAELIVPAAALAEAIAEEARSQGPKPDPAKSPLTQLALTAIDIVARQRDKIIDDVAGYAKSDLLCHWAEAPPELEELQRKIWQPLLDWCGREWGALLNCGAGIMPVIQPEPGLAALRAAVAGYDDFRLAGLAQATGVCGSLVLGLALATGHLSAEQVFEAAELDTTFQIQKWGEDPVATARQQSIRQDLDVCERWFKLLRT
ncbi:MAG: ATP12 family chaperone protein [Bdellovibrionales bacterium]